MTSTRTCQRFLIAAAPLLLLGCGGGQSSAGTPSHPLDSPEWTEASAPKTPEPAIAEPARDPRCTGAAIDASRLARSGACNIEGHGQGLPAAIVASMASPSATTISGQEITVQLLLRNTGSEDAELFLDHSCGFENLTTMVLRDAHGNRLDRVGRGDCPLDQACVGQVAHFTLAPQGVATITLPLAGWVRVIGDQCEELPGRALSPGAYTVEWQTPYAPAPLATRLTVEALARLPKSQCKAYAQAVAKKAEPDIKLRRAVERDLLASCQKEQPSQAFADCRMNAETEIALASCQEVILPR